MSHAVADKDLTVTKALPAAAGSASTDAIDLGAVGSRDDFLANMEFEISVPATPDLVEAKTIIVDIQTDDDVTWGSAKTIIDNIFTVTGQGAAAGGVATSERFRVPSNVERYIRATATVLASGGDNTGVSFTLKPLF
ncbi:MAG TPA: hypothetical protein VFH53_05725 [Phycisphaerae bacterium]|nr:hypothetical protein [Phycisphaerae bacterium]